MQPHQAIDECFAHQSRIIGNRGQLTRYRIANDDAVPTLHQEKGAADHRWIFAQQKHLGRFRKVRMDGMQHAVFARHVMRFGRHGPERRTSQNIFTASGSNQIYKVGVAMGKLFDLDAGRAFRQAFAQVIR